MHTHRSTEKLPQTTQSKFTERYASTLQAAV